MTKKRVALPLMMVAIVLLPHAAWAAEFELRVSGSTGLPFSGLYTLSSTDKASNSNRIEGKVPATLRWSGDAIRIKIANASSAGKLTLKLYRNGRLAGQAMAQGKGGKVTLSAGENSGSWSQGYGGGSYGGSGSYGYGGGSGG